MNQTEKNTRKILKKKGGITLIALVVTIIVLLILAGISIAMLTGDNGILTRAGEAKTNTDKAQIVEQARLDILAKIAEKKGQDLTEEEIKEILGTYFTSNSMPDDLTDLTQILTTKNGGYEVTLAEVIEGVGIDGTKTAKLPKGPGTKPYLPSESFHQLPGTTLDNGLVITDAEDPTSTTNPGNEYVWIEVPSTAVDEGATGGPDYSGVSGPTDYGNIARALRTYCTKDASNGNLITIGTSLDSDKTSTYGYTDTWYSGCGIANSDDYDNLYHAMLKSVYENGGFWIGRYEAGTTEARESHTSIDRLIPLSKVNLYPINYVYCSEAQTIASRITNIGSYNSSLMFGIQWDLVLRHLSNKGVATNLLNDNSSTWGNYNDQAFDINRGKYSQASPWNVYIDYTIPTPNKVTVENGVSRKVGTTSTNIILLTTGASDTNMKKNIYDLAGNVYECTLEKTSDVSFPCAIRCGDFSTAGSYYPASYRGFDSTSSSSTYVRFQSVTLLIRRPKSCMRYIKTG